MMNVVFRNSFCLLSLCLFLMPKTSNAQVFESLAEFSTDTGQCSLETLIELRNAKGDEFTYTLEQADIISARGLATPETDATIPPITPLVCHFADEEAGQILVSSQTDGYCGWIASNSVLKGQISTGIEAILGAQTVCGSVKPMSVKDFCSSLLDYGGSAPECLNDNTANSPFDAKFIIYNAVQGEETKEVLPVEVPVFPTASAAESLGNRVTVFNVFRIYAVEKGPNSLRLLIGSNERNMIGWIDYRNGATWYSKLSTFFSLGSTGQVFLEAEGETGRQVIATAPDNLQEMFSENRQFRRFPVLLDSQAGTSAGDTRLIDIAFIGSFCTEANGQLCLQDGSGTDVSTAALIDSSLSNIDVLFLVDGTASMQRYFGLVSDAIRELVAANDFRDPNIRFGVAMYGDFINAGSTREVDPVQFEIVEPLGPLLLGDRFKDLASTNLFIDDALNDKPEASNAAILRSISRAKWRLDVPKFLIHIADHGDRVEPSSQLIRELRENRIFYTAIAVRGDSIIEASYDFVSHASYIHERLLTDEGIPQSNRPLVTYNDGSVKDYEAILRSLNLALSLKDEVRNLVNNDGRQLEAVSNTDNRLFPDGHANITRAAVELFLGPEYLDGVSGLENKYVAAEGFIEATVPDTLGDDWDFFAAIRPAEIGKLRSSFEFACRTVRDSDARATFLESIREIFSTLTGDDLSDLSKFRSYLQNKDKIPLVSEIIVGQGLVEIASALGDPTAEPGEKVQKSICRSAELLRVMNDGRIVLNPYDSAVVDGGQLVWDPVRNEYRSEGDKFHDWLFVDDFDRVTVFLPLAYLPSLLD